MNDTDLDRYCDESSPLLRDMLSATDNAMDVKRRFADMLTDRFPDCESAIGLADVVVRRLLAELTRPTNVNITINNVQGNQVNQVALEATIAPTKVKAQKVKLAFRLIDDPRLDLTERIIFSLCWKWAHCNRKKPKVVAISKFRRFTGFRAATIKASLSDLIQYGYINDRQEPLIAKHTLPNGKIRNTLNNGQRYMAYRSLEWVNDSKDCKRTVFNGVRLSNTKKGQNTPAWYRCALGVSLRTAKRYIEMPL